jgi:hypothetical protein
MFKITYKTVGLRSETIEFYCFDKDQAMKLQLSYLDISRAVAQSANKMLKVKFSAVPSRAPGVIAVYSVTATQDLRTYNPSFPEIMLAVVTLQELTVQDESGKEVQATGGRENEKI